MHTLAARRLRHGLRGAFMAWRHATARRWAGRREFHTRIARALQPRQPGTLNVCATVLSEWRAQALGARGAAAVACWAAASAARRRKTVLFCRWARRTGERQQQRQLLRSTRVASAGTVLRRALAAWRSAASSSRVGHVLEYQATSFWIRRALTTAWIEWRKSARSQATYRRHSARAARVHAARMLGRAWRCWRTVVAVRDSAELQLLLAQHRRLQQALRAVSRGEERAGSSRVHCSALASGCMLRRSWQVWRGAIAAGRGLHVRAARFQRRRGTRVQALCVHAWRHIAVDRRRHQSAALGRLSVVLEQGTAPSR